MDGPHAGRRNEGGGQTAGQVRPSIFKLAADWRLLAGLAGLAAVLLAASLPLGSAIQFGADEGMELSKALIYAEHPSLVARLWNDQPALYTELLSAAFKLFSPTILVARLVAVAFGALIIISIWGIVSELADKTAGVWAAIFFLLSPRVLTLLVSTMIELPAFALALASFWTVLVARRKGSRPLLAASALLYGCALNIKLTAVVMLPAVCLHWLLFESNSPRDARPDGRFGGAGNTRGSWFEALKPLACWLAAVGAAWVLLLWAIPGGANWNLLWGSHARSGGAFLARNPVVYGFPRGEYFAAHAEGTLGTILGCCVLVYATRWRALLFPVSFALVALVLHSYHRPWWWYYWLHFAVPMSMLSGMGLRALAALAAEGPPRARAGGVRALCCLTAIACLAATTGLQAVPRVAAAYSALRNAPSIQSSSLLKEVLKHKARARWLYSLDAKYSFFSQIPSPPELAVLPLKRFYSGGITFAQILAWLKEYKVGEILLTAEPDPDGQWSRFLAANYVRVFHQEGCALYIAKAILP
jgi:hypothetical protein